MKIKNLKELVIKIIVVLVVVFLILTGLVSIFWN